MIWAALRGGGIAAIDMERFGHTQKKNRIFRSKLDKPAIAIINVISKRAKLIIIVVALEFGVAT